MKFFTNYYISVIKKYTVFNGRASRAEYWYFYLINVLISFLLVFLEIATGIGARNGENPLNTLYQLFVLLPSIAVGIRRMHDVNKSGWFLLIPIYSFILAVSSGTKGENRFGPDPKLTTASNTQPTDLLQK